MARVRAGVSVSRPPRASVSVIDDNAAVCQWVSISVSISACQCVDILVCEQIFWSVYMTVPLCQRVVIKGQG